VSCAVLSDLRIKEKGKVGLLSETGNSFRHEPRDESVRPSAFGRRGLRGSVADAYLKYHL